MEQNSSRTIPKSLERLLTITPSPSNGVTSALEPSSLLAKLDSFLPMLKEANSRLEECESEKLNSIPAPKRIRQTEDSSKDSKLSDDDIEEDNDQGEEDLAVNMDVYLDDALGEIVPNDDIAQTEQPQAKKPLIQIVETTK